MPGVTEISLSAHPARQPRTQEMAPSISPARRSRPGDRVAIPISWCQLAGCGLCPEYFVAVTGRKIKGKETTAFDGVLGLELRRRK